MLVLEGVGKTLHLGGFEKFSEVRHLEVFKRVTTLVHSTDFHDPVYNGSKFLTIYIVGPSFSLQRVLSSHPIWVELYCIAVMSCHGISQVDCGRLPSYW